MRLILVDSGDDARRAQQLLHLLDGAVAHADGPHLAGGDQPLHGGPGVVDGEVGEADALGGWVDGVHGGGVLERDGPVDLAHLSVGGGGGAWVGGGRGRTR